MSYKRMFSATGGKTVEYPVVSGDLTDPQPYVFTEEIEFVVNVALATARPLLVQGPPGSGKTSLGRALATRLDWDLYEIVISSRTRGQDLLWRFDAVRRLADAHAGPGGATSDPSLYVKPGPLWWALDPNSAAVVGAGDETSPAVKDGAVVVIDEIDKADPGVLNDLLRPLGDMRFTVDDLDGRPVARSRVRPPLVVITSNRERSLPPPFVRRCVLIELPGFSAERLLEIAVAHFGATDTKLHKRVVEALLSSGSSLVPADGLSAAEYLDAIRASKQLEVGPRSSKWDALVRSAVGKSAARDV